MQCCLVGPFFVLNCTFPPFGYFPFLNWPLHRIFSKRSFKQVEFITIRSLILVYKASLFSNNHSNKPKKKGENTNKKNVKLAFFFSLPLNPHRFSITQNETPKLRSSKKKPLIQGIPSYTPNIISNMLLRRCQKESPILDKDKDQLKVLRRVFAYI